MEMISQVFAIINLDCFDILKFVVIKLFTMVFAFCFYDVTIKHATYRSPVMLALCWDHSPGPWIFHSVYTLVGRKNWCDVSWGPRKNHFTNGALWPKQSAKPFVEYAKQGQIRKTTFSSLTESILFFFAKNPDTSTHNTKLDLRKCNQPSSTYWKLLK